MVEKVDDNKDKASHFNALYYVLNVFKCVVKNLNILYFSNTFVFEVLLWHSTMFYLCLVSSLLPHNPRSGDSEACLVIKDKERDLKKDHEENVEAFKAKLEAAEASSLLSEVSYF